MEAAKKNLIYLVVIFLCLGITVYIWTKDSNLETEVQDPGSEIAYEGEGEYIEDEAAIDSETEESDEEAVQEYSEIINEDTAEMSAKKSRDSVRKANLSYIYSQLLIYYDEHGDTYPVGGDKMIRLNDKDTAVYKELVPGYVSEDKIKDPKDPGAYFGYKSPDGKDFELTALLENLEDKDCIKTNDLCIYKYGAEGVVSGR